jgi:tetratricopeptide (TPR) repeat protein
MNTNAKAQLKARMKQELNALLGGVPVELTEADAKQYHPAADTVFLERLIAGMISDQERKELCEHLSRCTFCREEIEELHESGALPRDIHTKKENQGLVPLIRKTGIWIVASHKQVLAVAASVLIIAGVVLFSLHSNSPSQIAHNNVLKMLGDDEKDFSMLLADNGYRLDGFDARKSSAGMDGLDDHKRTVRAAYEKLVADYPANIKFRTEYGKYLLFVLQDTVAAKSELEKALGTSLVPSEMHRVPELRLLLGIAAFVERDDAAAQEQFRHVLDLAPQNLDARVNLASSLYRSGEQQRAIEMLEQLRKENIPTPLLDRIDSFLENQ